MSRLPVEAFIALRYLRPRRTFVSVITVISAIGVMLGVAVLIIVISVMSGFDKEWRDKILGFNAHLKIYQLDPNTFRETLFTDYAKAQQIVAANKKVLGVAPFVSGQVMLKTDPAGGGDAQQLAPMMLGLDPVDAGKVSVLPKSMIAGAFDLSGNGLILGEQLASGLNVTVGDRVNIYSPKTIEQMQKTHGQTNEQLTLPDEYEVRGIFDVGFAEYNSSVIVVSLENAQQLNNVGDSVRGLQILLTDAFQADMVRDELRPLLGPNYQFITWREENKRLFNALSVEKNMMFFLLFFIMIVAAFGIVNSQITFVVQKTHEIGILKAIGASDRQVLWIFLSQSMVIAVLGVLSGLGFALLALQYRNEFLALLRKVTGIELLPAAIYQTPELPVWIQPMDIAVICGTAFVACVLAGMFPAWKASRLQPVEALRYE
ncbi:MAG: transporter permease [Verrucomicrobiales bacterium]|nr:transporter permease [Verrucomicrobiales bacterium]